MRFLILFILLLPIGVVAEPKLPIKVEAIVTGYSSSIDETDDTPRIMASGEEVYWGAIACPRSLPFGTMIGVAGELFICEDRMARKNDGNFDLWFPSKGQAVRFGRHRTDVYIYY